MNRIPHQVPSIRVIDAKVSGSLYRPSEHLFIPHTLKVFGCLTITPMAGCPRANTANTRCMVDFGQLQHLECSYNCGEIQFITASHL